MFTPQTILGLFNTVYLKVHWKHFDEADTQPEPFTLVDGEQADVRMMHAHELETDIVQTDRLRRGGAPAPTVRSSCG